MNHVSSEVYEGDSSLWQSTEEYYTSDSQKNWIFEGSLSCSTANRISTCLFPLERLNYYRNRFWSLMNIFCNFCKLLGIRSVPILPELLHQHNFFWISVYIYTSISCVSIILIIANNLQVSRNLTFPIAKATADASPELFTTDIHNLSLMSSSEAYF